MFRARRPFHPQRLHDALADLTCGVLRGRGHCRLASQPGQAIAWEPAGGLSMGDLGRWLAALPDHRWPDAARLAADRVG